MDMPRFRLTYLALATLYALSGPALVQAQTGTAAVSLSIPAQPLGEALNELARQAGLELSFPADVVAGKSAPAVNGALPVRQALDQLLRGSGLTADIQGRQVIVRPLSATSAAVSPDTLSIIRVQADAPLPRQAANNYTVSRSSSATKLDLSVKDTPQSMTIITQKQIEEQNLQSVNDVLASTPGVTVSNFGVPGAGRVTYTSRGHEINNVMLDGNPTLISGVDRGMELLAAYDTAVYERVEVTRGSTGLSTGTGDPSASINFVRKRPTLEATNHARFTYGRWAQKRAEIDMSRPLSEDGSVRGRVVAVYGNGGHWVDRVKNISKTLYGIVEADISDSTTIALGGTFYDRYIDDATPHGTSMAVDNSPSAGAFNGGRHWNAATDWSYAKLRSWNAFLTLDHQINDDWKVSANYQYTRSSPDRKWGIVGTSWYNADYDTASFQIGREKTDSAIHNLDITLSGKFMLFGREAQLATGINGYRSATMDPLYGTAIQLNCMNGTRSYSGCISMDDWNNGAYPYPQNTRALLINRYGEYPLDTTFGTGYDRKEKQYGYFLSGKFEPMEGLKVILGARYNRYDIKTDYYLRGEASDLFAYSFKPKDKWVPYAGVVYDLTPLTALYASYTGIYKAQLEKNIHDGFLPFIEGNSVELGVKSALHENRLNLHAALFSMKQTNVPNRYLGGAPINPDTGLQYRCRPLRGGNECEPQWPGDGPTVSGLEVSAAGQVLPGWFVNAGYTYLHVDHPASGYARENSNSMSGGDYSYERPKHAINISTSRQLNDTWTVGGALRWKSRTSQNANLLTVQGKEIGVNDVLSQGSYMVVDLMARYQLNKDVTLGVNLGNVFDKTYRANNRGSFYGSPRNLTVSVNARF